MPEREPTDAALLRRSHRHPDAFVEVCRRHSTALAGWLGAELRDDTLAHDLLAETFAEAWFSRRRFTDPGDGSARAWLFGIARNLVRRVHRDRAIATRGRARLGLPVPEPDAYGELIERQRTWPLEAAPSWPSFRARRVPASMSARSPERRTRSSATTPTALAWRSSPSTAARFRERFAVT
jgi:DNA-directed RNA polymerase specialized sigma24 family protein